MSVRLGIIGGGVMGEALLSRLLAQKLYSPDAVLVGEPAAERRQALSDQYGVQTTGSNKEVIASSETILLAVKPQIFKLVANDFTTAQGDVGRDRPPLVISILAGVTLAQLESAMPDWPVIRTMPNTPATVGAGMTAIALGSQATDEHGAIATEMFGAVGEVVQVSEGMLDAVTGLSGSGPGYIAIVIEALADGGVAAGLPRAIASQLAAQTVLGTAKLVQETGMHPAALKDRVTSPGGTTIAGIARLEESGLRSALIEAVRTASERSRQLGQSS
ncbi:MAG: pyrroline-5-carboxylate reductase [Cyanobacteria bacterium J06555_13]